MRTCGGEGAAAAIVVNGASSGPAWRTDFVHTSIDPRRNANDLEQTIVQSTNEPVIAMALAMDRDRLIGRDGAMPWHIPGELAHFKAVTLGKPILMGRKTFASIGKALPGRPNIVITRDADWSHEGVDVAHSLDQALTLGRRRADELGTDELVIIGGAAICREAMPVTSRFYLTLIDALYEGDTWLDAFDWSHWRELSRVSPDPATTGGVRIHYVELERLRNGA